MPPDMDFLDKLRLARVYVVTQIELTEEEFDKNCLYVLQRLVEHTIEEIEFKRLF